MATCDSSQILANAIAAGYGRLSKRDLVAVCVSSISASTLEASSQSLGYSKLSEYDTAECVVQALCSSPGTSNTADQIIAAAQANKISQLSRRDLDAVEVSLLCTKTNPPCSTPSAPINPTAKVIGNSTILIIWNQLANTGSLITSYTVKWGTVTGVYTNSATTAGPIPKSYTITGLISGTQYFFVVQANTAIGGCVSVNSNEGNATTTGTAPSNGLLNGLVSYWAYESAAGTDNQDGNTLAFSGGVFGPGFHNNDFGYGGAGFSSLNPCPANMQLGAGKSFSISTWQFVPVGGFSSANDSILGQYSNVAATISYYVYGVSTNDMFRFITCDSALNFVGLDIGTPNHNAWNHLVIGYDSSTKTMFGQLNGGTRKTQVIANDVNNSAFQYTTGQLTAQTHFAGAIDETAFWNRVLSTTDVSNLYNAGAGLFFPSFQP